MKSFFSIVRKVQLRELKRISGTPLYFLAMVVIPLFCLFFFLHIMSVGLPHSLPIAVVDLDNSHTSRSLISNLESQQQNRVVLRTTSFEEARVAMQRGKIFGIYLIPQHFGSSIVRGTRPRISYYYNAAYLMAGSLVFKDMKMMSEMVNGKAMLTIAQAHGISEEAAMAQIQPIKVQAHIIGNKWLNYSIYLNNSLIPGILQLMVFLITAYSIGTEIKYRTSIEWLEQSKHSMSLALLGKLSVHFVIFLCVGLLCLSVLYGYLGFPLQGGWWRMITAMILLILASQSIGIFCIAMLPTLRLGMSLSTLLGMLSFSVTGFSFPLSAMPTVIQALAYLFPLRHYFLIYADQALNSTPLYYSLPWYMFLLGFLILPTLIGEHLKKAVLEFKYVP